MDAKQRAAPDSATVEGAKVVTGLAPSRRDPALIDVRVGSRRVATVEGSTLDRLGIALGTPWLKELEAAVMHAAEVEKAKRRAVRMLATRGRSSGELRGLLIELGFGAEATAEAVGVLVEAGLLNDAEHAANLAQRELLERPAPRERLVEALINRGIAGELARQAVTDALVGRSDTETAVDLCHELARGSPRDEQAARRRVTSALLRRGFDDETTSTAVNQVLGPPPGADEAA